MSPKGEPAGLGLSRRFAAPVRCPFETQLAGVTVFFTAKISLLLKFSSRDEAGN
jgi:hypothetical protein